MEVRRVVLVAPASGREWFPMMTVTLGAVAAAVPADVEVVVLDGRAMSLSPGLEREVGDGDLVGLTFECFRAPLAYRLADALRARGVPVIAGGAHASAAPREVLTHVDAVVVGEVEGLWPSILADARAGKLRRIYRHARPLDLSELPPPRLDLVPRRRYLPLTPVEATRGCPHRCGFCTSRLIQGAFRTIPVEKVLAEVQRAPTRGLVFVDDNLPASRPHARALFEGMKGMRKQFLVQAHILMAEDRDLLRAAAEAGCRGVFVGLESVSDGSLAGVDKSWNRVERYAEWVQRFHDAGIGVSAGIIFGLDGDGPDVFERTLDALEEIRVDTAAANLLVPFPGTELQRRVIQEGRLLDRDYEKYFGQYPLVRPRGMTVDELVAGYRRFCEHFYSWRAAYARWRASGLGWGMLPFLIAANFSYRSWRDTEPRPSIDAPFPEVTLDESEAALVGSVFEERAGP